MPKERKRMMLQIVVTVDGQRREIGTICEGVPADAIPQMLYVKLNEAAAMLSEEIRFGDMSRIPWDTAWPTEDSWAEKNPDMAARRQEMLSGTQSP